MPHRLGQVFLTSQRIAASFGTYAMLSKSDVVLEIGPGKGIITRYLLKLAGKVYAIEIDPELIKELEAKFQNLVIIKGDALEVPWPKDANKLVSNLPYYISSEVIFKLAREPQIKLAVLGLQKDFALRLVAEPGSDEYSRISAAAQFIFDIEYLADIPKRFFRPVPKVDGAIVRLRRKELPDDYEEFLDFLRDIFPYKNKKIGKALKHAGYTFESISIDKRVKELGSEELYKIFHLVKRA